MRADPAAERREYQQIRLHRLKCFRKFFMIQKQISSQSNLLHSRNTTSSDLKIGQNPKMENDEIFQPLIFRCFQLKSRRVRGDFHFPRLKRKLFPAQLPSPTCSESMRSRSQHQLPLPWGQRKPRELAGGINVQQRYGRSWYVNNMYIYI